MIKVLVTLALVIFCWPVLVVMLQVVGAAVVVPLLLVFGG